MITKTAKRDKGDGYNYDTPSIQEPVGKALASLVVYELGYGAIVTEVTKTRVTVVTRIMGCVDTTIFEGVEDEMTLLVEAASIAIVSNPMQAESPLHDIAVDSIMVATGGNPLLIKMGHGMIAGRISIRAILMVMMGFAAIEQAPSLKDISVEDQLAIMMLVRIDGVSVADAIELATSKPVYGADGKIKSMEVVNGGS